MPPNKILIDSSFLIALYDADAAAYDEVGEISRLYNSQFLIPQVVLTEVVYLLKRDLGVKGAVAFLEKLADTKPALQDITVEDLARVKTIMQQYADADLDFVDCCLMALSERLNIKQIGTLDRRDFTLFRPQHCDYLEILP